MTMTITLVASPLGEKAAAASAPVVRVVLPRPQDEGALGPCVVQERLKTTAMLNMGTLLLLGIDIFC